LNDYVNEYIFREHAQKEYRVVIAESGNIDHEATKKLHSLLQGFQLLRILKGMREITKL